MFCSFKFTLPSQVNLSINSGEKAVPDAYGFSIPSWDIPINFNFTKFIITNIFQQKDHLAQILNNFVIHMTKAILLHYTPEDFCGYYFNFFSRSSSLVHLVSSSN